MMAVCLGALTACQQNGSEQDNSQSTEKLSMASIDQQSEQQFHDFSTETLNGGTFNFKDLSGKRVLIVNTASECGYTPQYEQLQELYDEYGGEDFTIIGFPSNDFGNQEPGSNEEIAAFCKKNFGVSFPMMAKTPVTGEDKHAVYQWLTDKERNGRKSVEVQWNFNKFLISAEGEWVAYYPSSTSPLDEKIIDFAAGKPIQP